MRKTIYLYLLLFLFLSVQCVYTSRFSWMPDLTLTIVVFTGIFKGGVSGALMGLVAGFLRGAFSPGTMLVDIYLFSAVGVASPIVSRMFYRQNPAVQMFTVLMAMLSVVAVHTMVLNMVGGNSIGMSFMIRKSLLNIVVTAVFAPFLFFVLEDFLRVREL